MDFASFGDGIELEGPHSKDRWEVEFRRVSFERWIRSGFRNNSNLLGKGGVDRSYLVT